MKTLFLAIALTVSAAAPANALTYYLTSQWYAGGNHFCAYSNGTVLNVGYRLCPLSIQG
jgi:hypothetical protein